MQLSVSRTQNWYCITYAIYVSVADALKSYRSIVNFIGIISIIRPVVWQKLFYSSIFFNFHSINVIIINLHQTLYKVVMISFVIVIA